MTTINQLMRDNGFVKTKPESNCATYLDSMYPYHQYLENFNTLWYIKIDKPTRMCKFYSVHTKFSSKDSFETINNYVACNTYSGKCNRYLNDLQQVDDFIKEVQLADKFVGELEERGGTV